MTKFNIEEYLKSLPDDTTEIDVSCKKLTYLPDLSRFKNLKYLYCSSNKLTSLPVLNEKLIRLNCSGNQLTSLPKLNEKLKILYCSNNQLTSLPALNKNLKVLSCSNNQLTSLPGLNKKLKDLYCSYNQLKSLPVLNEKFKKIIYHNNPIYEIICNESNIGTAIKTLYNFRYLYYCLKYKKRLWKIRESAIIKKYHPNYLHNLKEEDDLEEILEKW
jgi:Leucine-rich repeat (LRR) protein